MLVWAVCPGTDQQSCGALLGRDIADKMRSRHGACTLLYHALETGYVNKLSDQKFQKKRWLLFSLYSRAGPTAGMVLGQG